METSDETGSQTAVSREASAADIPALRRSGFGWNWLKGTMPQVKRVVQRVKWLSLLEAALIVGWAFWVGRQYLNFSLTSWIRGDEISMVTTSHFVWTLLPKCGACVMWNGFINGGAPAFAELMGSVLHPLTILTTLIWGVINGTKLLIIFSLAVAGLAQWWVGRVLKLGWVARMWSAALAVVGGQLISKMDDGNLPLIYSMAFASLILAPGLELALTRKRRSLILLGVALALTWLSGQGYTQVVVVIGLLPAFIVFLFDRQFHLKPVWKDFGLAGLLSILLSGVLLVPVLHFWPNFVKDGDPFLTGFPPLEYNPLNLVIRDWQFFQTEVLGHSLNLYQYFIYIGWVPVLLAFLSLRLVPREKSRVLAFFWLGIGLIFLVCSADFARLVIKVIPEMGYLRYLYAASGLVVPFVLGLAAWGLDLLLKVTFPRIGVLLSSGRTAGFSLAWVVVGVPILLAIKPAYDMAGLWLVSVPLDPPAAVVQAVNTPSSQWISPPLTEYFWMPVLLNNGIKITGVFRPWHWNGRQEPGGYLQIVRDSENKVTENVTGTFNDIKVVQQTSNEYAYIQNGDGLTPCAATALGGNIDVSCTSDQGGTLIVHENNWSGWRAWMDGKSTPLAYNDWLVVPAPAGSHHFTFRYRPWDVPVGLLVTLAGVGLAVWIGRRKEEEGVDDEVL
jgi:hypothetical protein